MFKEKNTKIIRNNFIIEKKLKLKNIKKTQVCEFKKSLKKLSNCI